ncbi:MAG: phosphatase PAP2 family protein [Candidatus Sungiibacteriota bacterium]|uniref:Phosphatase PAP2 family protein n=1 Tax=Candidatus Sungiibacteriota bacterium TaxID=2750080 RepID=A0A7T5UQD2_9BACT|nr:MAG: phosphatase PAP2 family protein [Candidatus Sungbacteria bacterium]
MIQQLDIVVFRWLNSWVGTSTFFDWAIRFRAVWFLYIVIAALLLFFIFTLWIRFRDKRRRNLGLVVFAIFSALLARFAVTELVRFIYNRPRPFEVLEEVRQIVEHTGGGSFPSGHATFAFAIAAAVSFYYPKTSILFFLAAFSVGLGRVAAGVHWPSDILGAAAVGILTAWLLGKILKIKSATL